ncbi:unnamed protein product [Owenia fusiformis]|uniref:Protein-lysine N-methyltransferase SMYD4 n=1 Tax=Owenia fusiformis TaxID=6347 RepID=A0A8J1UCF5_OWEFU|nr:unnamed protein product [Owenia fusiformis]
MTLTSGLYIGDPNGGCIRSNQSISRYLETVSSNRCNKNASSSARLRTEGNDLFKKRKYDKVLEKYTQSILCAPVDTEGKELALGYANRSAVLFHKKLYQLCLNDTESALKHGYPGNLHYKIYQRQANCYLKLGEKTKADKACEAANENLNNVATDLSDDKKASTLKDIETLCAKIKLEDVSYPACNTDVTPLRVTYGKNDVITQASAAINVKVNKQQGRFLVANQDIKAGDTLIVEKPFTAVLLPDHYDNHCHHCFVKLTAPLPCHQCIEVKYCSEVCRAQSWSTYHNIECGYLDLLHSIGVAHLALRTVLVAGLETLLDHRSSLSTAPIGQSIAGADSSGWYGNTYTAVYHLMPHEEDMLIEDMFQYTLTAALLLKYLEQTSFFHPITSAIQSEAGDQSQPNGPMKPLTEKEAVTYIGGLLLRHIQQLVCNAHAITELDAGGDNRVVMTTSQVRVATAIYPTASLMNHSCIPNIISSFNKDTLVVCAVEDVPAGGEIFNCYGPHANRMDLRERQEALRIQYFFDCTCQACISDGKKDLIFKALKCLECSGPLGPPEPEMTCLECGHVTTDLSAIRTVLDTKKLFMDGQVLVERTKVKDALKKLLECYNQREPVMYKHNRELAEVQDQIARCYAELGDTKTALKYLDLSITTTEKMFGPTSIELGNELHKKAEIMFNGRMVKEALVVIEKALDIFKLNYGEDHVAVQELFNMKVCLLQAHNDQWLPYKQKITNYK